MWSESTGGGRLGKLFCMPYAILRLQKLKSPVSIQRSLAHAFREVPTPNALAAKTPENVHLGASSSSDAMAKLLARLPEKRRADAVLCIEYLVTASPEAMGTLDPAAYFADALAWLQARHGAANVVYSGQHFDEQTPHLYAYVVPLDEATGRLNARKWMGAVNALGMMQTDFATEVGAKHGLARGIEGSKAIHQRVKRHYGLVNEAAGESLALGMLDKASLAIGKPSKRAQEALERADSTLALAHEFQGRQKAIKQREKVLLERETTLAIERAHAQQRESEAARVIEHSRKEIAELRRELADARYRAKKSEEMAEVYRAGRDEAIEIINKLTVENPNLDL